MAFSKAMPEAFHMTHFNGSVTISDGFSTKRTERPHYPLPKKRQKVAF